MPAVAREHDPVLTGHQCDVMTTIDTHSSNVFANNIAVARKNDTTQLHTIGSPPTCIPHVAPITQGSPTVFINNIPCARFGDSADAGVIIAGSDSVFADGGGGPTTLSTSPESPVVVSAGQLATYQANVANVQQYNTPDNVANGVDKHPEMPDDPAVPVQSTVNPNCTGAGDMGAALDQRLAEAASGSWKETGHNPNITALYANVGFPNISGDQTAWCAAFAGSVLKANCFKYLKSLAAGSYTGYGNPVDISSAQKGDVIVFNRDAGTGHVCFYYGPGPRPGTIVVVGGNQSDNVTKSIRNISEIKPNGVQRPIPA